MRPTPWRHGERLRSRPGRRSTEGAHGGAHRDPQGMAEAVKQSVIKNLAELRNQPVTQLLDARQAPARIGVPRSLCPVHKYLTRCAASCRPGGRCASSPVPLNIPRRRRLAGTTIRGRSSKVFVRRTLSFPRLPCARSLTPIPRRRHGVVVALSGGADSAGLLAAVLPWTRAFAACGCAQSCRSWLADCRRRFRRVLRGIVPRLQIP